MKTPVLEVLINEVAGLEHLFQKNICERLLRA